MPNIFKKTPIEVPNRSAFDESHEHIFTAKPGTLVPAMIDELNPNETIKLGFSSTLQLPPMATDFYGRCEARFEAFFVPSRLLYGGWQDLITQDVNSQNYPSGSAESTRPHYLPFLKITNSNYLKPGSLADYLGIKASIPSTGVINSYKINNPLPFVAYHRVYDDFYRDARVQKPVFYRPENIYSSGVEFKSTYMPYVSFTGSTPTEINNFSLGDGKELLNLRQRNFGKDYFTNASLMPQSGSGSFVKFQTDEDGNGQFSIASLRAANSLQQWLERNNIAGMRYADQIRGQFGILPSDATLDRPIYLGSARYDVYNKSVYQSTEFDSDASSSRNPFNSVGSKYGSPIGYGSSNIVDKFTSTEHGFILVMFSLVPHVLYGTGTRRMFGRSTTGDFPFPILAGIGDQRIKLSEVHDDAANQAFYEGSTFGYTQRYSEFKFMKDHVSGLLRDGQSLSAFALKRSFTGTIPTQISSSFLEIPETYFDDVSAVADSVSEFGCWVDVFFKYHKVSTLPAYSIPTLGDMKNTHTITVDTGGFRL